MPAPPRLVVVGTSCAGKSTFGRALSAALGCPFVELDELHWGPEWTPKPLPEFRELVAQAVSTPAWLVAGNYSVVRDQIWPRANAVVWLNYSFARVLWQGLRRTIRRSVTREELWHGNRESFRRSFLSRDSILVWIATTYHRRRRELAALRASGSYPGITWFEFGNPKQARAWLLSLQNQD